MTFKESIKIIIYLIKTFIDFKKSIKIKVSLITIFIDFIKVMVHSIKTF